jgi:hypothetical protein
MKSMKSRSCRETSYVPTSGSPAPHITVMAAAARHATSSQVGLTMRRFVLAFAIASPTYCPVFAIAQSMPAKLAVPKGGSLQGKYTAKGVQIYVCHVNGAATEWAFKAPEAELVDEQGRQFAKHYAGPTWEAPDGSKIVGEVLASEPAPEAGAIPWLLLSTKTFGIGALAGVRFVQRVNTSGGVGPTGRCPTVGAEQRVGYTADYIFYR